MLPHVLSFLLPLFIYATLVLVICGLYRARAKLDRWALILAIGAFIASAAFRPNEHLLFFDEDIYIQIASNLSHAPVAQLTLFGGPRDIQASTYYKEPAGFPVLLSPIFAITGTQESVAFIVSRVLYAMAIAAVYLLGRAMLKTRLQAVAAAIAFAATPACFAFSASTGTDLPAAFFTALGILGIVSGNGMLAAGGLAMAAQVRLEMIILVPIILFADRVSVKWKAALVVLVVPEIVHIAWVFSIAPGLAAVEHVTSPFSLMYVAKNIAANLRYLFDPRKFPVAVPFLAVLAAVIHVMSRRAATECSPGREPGGDVITEIEPRRGERSHEESAAPMGLFTITKLFPGLTPGATLCRRFAAPSRSSIILSLWSIVPFAVYAVFYAGSFDLNPRYSLQFTIPLILLAVSFSERRVILAVIALSAVIPAVRRWEVPTYVQALASDHRTAVEFAQKLGSNDLVISGEPEIFINQGKYALNSVFGTQQPNLIRQQLGKFNRVFYYSGVRTNEIGSEQWEADRKVKSDFELHLFDAREFAGLRIAIYELLQPIDRESG